MQNRYLALSTIGLAFSTVSLILEGFWQTIVMAAGLVILAIATFKLLRLSSRPKE